MWSIQPLYRKVTAWQFAAADERFAKAVRRAVSAEARISVLAAQWAST